jgi:aryl-alcohol dehydrogenase-like predicted oxidoreductase
LSTVQYRLLGNSGIQVSAVSLGCWPIAGMTSPGVNDEDSLATIRACLNLGVNHLDTAYCYGREGQGERLIARALGSRRREVVLATKAGQHWDDQGQLRHDASPATLRRQCEESLRRLAADHVELLYLHAPDEKVPIAESAGALRRLLDEGKTRAVGVSNVDPAELRAFAAECPLAAYQPPYNMLQREIESAALPWCREHGVAVLVYWPLMKGLLAGKLARDQVFGDKDNRRKYAAFQGRQYQRNLDLVDGLRRIAAESGRAVAELVIAWTIHQPGITSALCGAKRPEQIRENAAAADREFTSDQLARVDRLLAEFGLPSDFD